MEGFERRMRGYGSTAPAPYHGHAHHAGGGGGGGNTRRPSPAGSSPLASESSMSEFSTTEAFSSSSFGAGSTAELLGGARKKSGGAKKSKKATCMHCSRRFRPDSNRRGDCPDAPDPWLTCLERVTCFPAAESVSYHCFSDEDGDYGHPCACSSEDDSGSAGGSCGLRWAALSVLAACLPCLCCYPVLVTGCYEGCCVRHCGCCGGRHEEVPDCERSCSISAASTSGCGSGASSGNWQQQHERRKSSVITKEWEILNE